MTIVAQVFMIIIYKILQFLFLRRSLSSAHQIASQFWNSESMNFFKSRFVKLSDEQIKCLELMCQALKVLLNWKLLYQICFKKQLDLIHTSLIQ